MHQRIAIREAQDTDAADVGNLIRDTIRTSNAKDYSASAIEQVANGFTTAVVQELLGRRIVLVAQTGDQIIGTASLDAQTVRSVFVTPVAQGRGVGRRLMSEVEAIALRNGVLELHVPASLTAAPFYQRLGSHKVGDAYHGEERTIVMLKKLA